ncbi:MAG TPA: hypothetical protein VFQ44_03640 [Streptosporangiaceae bacterium]|nr:hypothetical protein [Streptosporangiaceae bacterium]
MHDLEKQVSGRARFRPEGTHPKSGTGGINVGKGGHRDRLVMLIIAGSVMAGLLAATLALVPGMIGSAASDAASSPWGTCTEQVTLATSTGKMVACIDYRYTRKQFDVLKAAASYTSSSGYDLPYFTFSFRDPTSGATGFEFFSPLMHDESVYTSTTRLFDLARRTRNANIQPGDLLQVSLWATSAHTGSVDQMASVTLPLYLGGMRCPELGTSGGNGELTGQC